MDTTILYLPDRSRQQLFLRRTQFERRLLRDPLPGAFIAALQDKKLAIAINDGTTIEFTLGVKAGQISSQAELQARRKSERLEMATDCTPVRNSTQRGKPYTCPELRTNPYRPGSADAYRPGSADAYRLPSRTSFRTPQPA